MPPDAGLEELIGVRELPAAFERFRVVLASGDSRPSRPEDWTGCLVLVERGTVEVDCGTGGRRSFVTGDLVALEWLPLRTIRNLGTAEARLLAVRRRAEPANSPIHAEGGPTR